MTPEEQALLAAIAAHPEADLPRLVYSDWLQERNDERFEWVRDRELFGWMGPKAENPVPKLLDALDVAYGEDDDDRIQTLEALLVRCGPAAVGPLLGRLRGGHRWEEFVGGVAGEQPGAVAEHRAVLEGLLANGPGEVREVVLQLLVRAGEADPAALRVVLAQTLLLDPESYSPAYWALRQARGAAAEVVLDAWLPELDAETGHQDLADETRSIDRLECLAGTSVESPRLAETFRRAAVHPTARFASAGLEGLARMPGTDHEAASLALRTCTPTNALDVYALVRRLPDWERRLTEAITSPATPESARLSLIRNLTNLDSDWEAIRPMYAAALAHPDPECRIYALMALQESAGPTDAVRALFEAADEDENLGVRQMALQSFVQRDDTPERQRVTAIAAALGGKETGMADRAAELMELQGLKGAVAARLRSRLDDSDDQTRARAVAGLIRIGASSAVILGSLRDKSVSVRRAAARALSEMRTTDAEGAAKSLRRVLDDPDPVVRRWIAVALGNLGDTASAPDLLEMARDPEPHARAGALQALPKVAPNDAATTKALRRGLRDEDDRVVKATLIGLKEYFHPEPALQEAILPWTADDSPEFRRAAFDALYYLNEEELTPEAISALRRGLADPDADVAGAAMAAVYSIRNKGEPLADAVVAVFARPAQSGTFHVEEFLCDSPAAMRSAVALLGSPHPAVRQRTLALIGRVFEKSPDLRPELAAAAVPYLPTLLAQERGEKLETVLDLIHVVGPGAAACQPALLPLLDHPNARVREKALATAGRLGATALPAAERLTDVMLNDPSPAIRAAAVAGVVSLAEHDANLLPAVLRQLREGDTDVRKAVARRIGLHPALGATVLPPLARCLAPENDAELRGIAAESLGKQGEAMRPQAANFARSLGREADEDVRRIIAEACGSLGAVAADAVPHLMAHFRNEESTTVRERLIDAFAKIPCPQRGAAVALGLDDPDSGVREQVAMVLGDIGADAVSILPAVCKVLEDPKWDSVNDDRMAEYGQPDFASSLGIDRRQFLVQALGELGPLAEPAVPTLAKLLDDKHEGIRSYTVLALGSIGRAAIPALKKAARSRDAAVRNLATAQLEELTESEESK